MRTENRYKFQWDESEIISLEFLLGLSWEAGYIVSF